MFLLKLQYPRCQQFKELGESYFWKHHAEPKAGIDKSSFLFCLGLQVKFNQTWKEKKGTGNVIP